MKIFCDLIQLLVKEELLSAYTLNMAQNCIIDLRAFHYKLTAGIDSSEHHARKVRPRIQDLSHYEPKVGPIFRASRVLLLDRILFTFSTDSLTHPITSPLGIHSRLNAVLDIFSF